MRWNEMKCHETRTMRFTELAGGAVVFLPSRLPSRRRRRRRRRTMKGSSPSPSPSPLQSPLLLPPSHVDGCPGCSLALRKSVSTAVPKRQLFVIAFLVLCSALPISSLFPFIYFMVRDLGIAKSDTSIGSYAGYVGSALMFGRFLTSTPWGMVSDRFGRKPVMIIGTASVILFNTLFGFSTNYWVVLVSRFLLGASNGTLGSVRAYVSEICIEEQQALGLSVVGTMWGLGLIIGPAIGGFLAQPSDKYPALFPTGSLFDTFPYALPCLCISCFSVAGIVSFFWLPETIHNHSIVTRINVSDEHLNSKSNGTNNKEHVVEITEGNAGKAPIWKNRAMVAAISVYCVWGLHDMAYSEIFSLWVVSPTVYGGFGMTTAELGDILAVAGAAMLLFQLFAFATLAKRCGAISIARIPAGLSILLTLTYPLIVGLSEVLMWIVLISAAVIKNLLSICIVTGSFLMINNSVPTSQRGVANGISMTFMSLFKAVGPASAGALFSWAQARMDATFLPGMWLVFTVLAAPAVITFLLTFEPILPSSVNKPILEGTFSEAEQSESEEKLRRSSSFTFE